MKLLIVHNDYGKYSGEEAVVDTMAAALAARGVEVAQLRMTSAGSRESLLGQARGFVSGIYSHSGVKAMRQALAEHRPDVVNVHNLYPFISPAALQECRRAGVPVVMTVHNYRLICPTGLFMRDGRPCELCLQRGNEWACVRHNCEQSWLKSLGYAARNAAARLRRDYRDCVDRYVCITDFQRRKLIEAGYDADRIVVIPNGVEVTAEAPTAPQPPKGGVLPPCTPPLGGWGAVGAEPYVAYVGRLSYEKGADILVEAARRLPNIPFRMAGAVRDQQLVADLPDNVELVGYVSGADLDEFYRRAAFVVMPSRCYEGFPMAILEAARYARPTIGPDHGGFSDIIGHGDGSIGRLFDPGSITGLCTRIEELWAEPDLTARLGAAALEKLRTQYALPIVTDRWLSLLTTLKSPLAKAP